MICSVSKKIKISLDVLYFSKTLNRDAIVGLTIKMFLLFDSFQSQ